MGKKGEKRLVGGFTILVLFCYRLCTLGFASAMNMRGTEAEQAPQKPKTTKIQMPRRERDPKSYRLKTQRAVFQIGIFAFEASENVCFSFLFSAPPKVPPQLMTIHLHHTLRTLDLVAPQSAFGLCGF
eukprot:862416-Amphidinium_carterae.1